MGPDGQRDGSDNVANDRRAFLATAGKFAVSVPPAMVLLLSTSMNSPAIAQSAGGPCGCSKG